MNNFKLKHIIIIVFAVIIIFATYLYIIIGDIRENCENIKIEEVVDSTSGLIEVNGELIDEDDYNQMDWRSYTPASDSIK